MRETRERPQQQHKELGSPLARYNQKVHAAESQLQKQQRQQQQQHLVIRFQSGMEAKMEEGESRSSRRESNPLLSSKEKARSAVLLSIQSDIGKGIVYNIRLSRWYLAYCSLMAIATLSLVIFMIVDVHFRKNAVPVWVCAVDGVITFAVCFETIADMILLGKVGVVESLEGFVTVILLTIRYVAQFIRIARYIRSGTEAQDSLSAVEEHVIRFDKPSSRMDSGLRAAVPAADIDL